MDPREYVRDQLPMNRLHRQREDFERQLVINKRALAVAGGSCLVSAILAAGTLVSLFMEREPVAVECRIIESTPLPAQTEAPPRPQSQSGKARSPESGSD